MQIKKYTLLIVAVFTATILLTACTGDKYSSKGSPALNKLIYTKADSSLDLISKSKLDTETKLLYKVYAAFGDPKLPKEYASNTMFRSSNEVMYEVRTKYKTFSKKTQDALAPFLKRPEEEGSYFNLRYGGEASKKTSGLIPNAYAIRPNTSIYTEFFTSADNKVKIWYPNVDTNSGAIFGTGNVAVKASSAKTMAKKMKGYLDNDKIISKFKTLMGRDLMSDGTKGGDSKLDIYVAPTGSDLAITYGENGTPTASHILMNTTLTDDKVLKTTLAHEIFHSFQYVYKYDTTRDNWWGEATSVWSEDFIYPAANTEQEWLKRFINYPEVELFKETPPRDHHYAAYIFSYFMTKTLGKDLMKKTWEGCESKACIDAIDDAMDGGFEKQWKKFTLWNYNKAPAKFYTDTGGFPDDVSSDSGQYTTDVHITDKDTEVDTETLQPLTSEIDNVINLIKPEDKIKQLVFKDLNNFTGKTDKAGLKAVIYYKNGKKEIEDWTDKNKRAFCIENKEEDFQKVVLIFSNGEKKKNIANTNIKVEGKPTCFNIDQDNKTTAVLHFPYSERGAMKIVNINTKINTVTEGEPTEDAKEDAKYGYLTKWELFNEFDQVRDSFTVSCDGGPVILGPGWTTHAVATLEFDLGKLDKDNTFSVDLHYGYAPEGKKSYEKVPTWDINCPEFKKFISASTMDLSGYKFIQKGIWKGKISDMTADGAKLVIENSCLYQNCNTQTGAKFQTIKDPVTLYIKKGKGDK